MSRWLCQLSYGPARLPKERHLYYLPLLVLSSRATVTQSDGGGVRTDRTSMTAPQYFQLSIKYFSFRLRVG